MKIGEADWIAGFLFKINVPFGNGLGVELNQEAVDKSASQGKTPIIIEL